MKKLLSVVLALAMVLGCLSMVTFALGEENVAVKLTSTGVNWQRYYTAFNFFTDVAATGEDTKTVTLTFYNPNNYGVQFRLQLLGNPWKDLNIDGDIKVPAQSKRSITITKTFVNGKLTCSTPDGSYTADYTPDNLRYSLYIVGFNNIDCGNTTGDCYYVQESRNVDAIYSLGTAVTAAEMPQMPTGMRIDITETASANFYNNTLGLTTDDITEIGGNKYFVFKYRVFNLSDTASIIRFSVWADWTGISGGAVSKIGAHAYADYELKVPVNSDNSIGPNKLAISKLRLGFLTDDGSFTARESFVIQALNDLATAFFVPKVQGGPSDSLFNPTLLTGNAASYDEYKLSGMYLDVAQDAGAWNYVRNATLNLDTSFISTDESGNRWLIFSYRIYNLSNQAATFGFFAQGGSNGWGTISGAADSGSKVIDGQTYADYEVKIPVNADNTLGTDSGTTLAKVSLRMENKTAISAGQQFVIRALNENATVFFNGNVSSSKINNDTDAVYTAGDLVFGDSHYDTLLNTSTPTPNGGKIEGAELQLGSSLSVIYYATVDNNFISSGNDIFLEVTRNEKTVCIPGDKVGDTNKYSFTYTGINAQCMADTIDAVLFCGENRLDSYADYSVKQYAINMFGTTAEKLGITEDKFTQLKTLLRDMLIYGAEAQKKIGYKTSDLATEGTFADNYTIDSDKAKIGTPIRDVIGSDVRSAGLNISYVNKIYFRLADATNVTSVTINDVEATIKGGVVYTEAIKATGFDDVYELKVTTSEGTTTVKYNVNAYLDAMWDSAKVGNIVKALTNYGDSAKAYAKA